MPHLLQHIFFSPPSLLALLVLLSQALQELLSQALL